MVTHLYNKKQQFFFSAFELYYTVACFLLFLLSFCSLIQDLFFSRRCIQFFFVNNFICSN